MHVKTIAPLPRFRYKNLTWVSGRRYVDEAELEIIKTIPSKFPIKLSDGTVLNPPPVIDIEVKVKKTAPKNVKATQLQKENENENEHEDRSKGDTEVQGEEL